MKSNHYVEGLTHVDLCVFSTEHIAVGIDTDDDYTPIVIAYPTGGHDGFDHIWLNADEGQRLVTALGKAGLRPLGITEPLAQLSAARATPSVTVNVYIDGEPVSTSDGDE